MKKNFLGALFLSAIMILAGCNNSVTTTDGNSTNNNAAQTTTDVNYNLCKMTAETQIIEISVVDNKWAGAEITNHYYWYNPMIEGSPAYIEFKVTKDGKDAGYVMVSTTDKDVEVPEYYTEGKTVYEMLQDKAETKNITATRFNSFGYMAEIETGRNDAKRVFFGGLDYMNDYEESGRGNDNIKYEEYLKEYKETRSKIGAIGGTAKYMSEYYKRKAEYKQYKTSRGEVQPIYSSPISTSIADIDKLPRYAQHSKTDVFNAVGCGPVAATMVLAYWYLYHGKTNLFPAKPITSYDFNSNWKTDANLYQNEKYVMEQLGNSRYMNTNDGNTKVDKLWEGLWKYIADKGYNHGVFRQWWVDHNSDEVTGYWNTFPDWDIIYKEIQKDHPAIILYHDNISAKGTNHYAAIYRVTISRDTTWGTINDVYCDINTGWSGSENYPTRKSINAGDFIFYDVVTCNIW